MDLLSELNEPQRRAVTHLDGPLLVLAGAGSGKTRVITRRVAYLADQGIDPRAVLAITFTNKAAQEMRDRVAALGASGGTTLCTFHSLCARLLREFAPQARITQNYSIYDRDDQVRLVKQAMTYLHLDSAGLNPAAIHTTISAAKNALQTADVFAEKAVNEYLKTVAEVYLEYERRLAANNALDFDDLLLRTAFLLRDSADVRDLLSRRYQYVLIDEYQDTNHAQYLLAHTIAAPHKNLCVTGDPDQSIYAWRGADIRNILEFERDYPDAVVVRLEENYRSTAAILGAASTLIARNTRRKAKALWTRREGGADVHVLTCDDEHAEAREVVGRLQAAHGRGRDYGDVAIFYRINSLSRVVEEALVAAGVPYRVARGVEFYNRKEIKDVLAYLRLLANPEDDLSCRRIINTPPRRIGQTTVDRLAAFAAGRGMGLLDACHRADEAGLSAAAARNVQAFAAMMGQLAEDVDRPVHELVEITVQDTGLEKMLHDGGEESEQARANVGELISATAEFDAREDAGSLADYLQQISLVTDVDALDASGGAVTLMTLHAAKGLEFPMVFIIGCEEGLLPFQRGDGDNGIAPTYNPADLEEERRLAFVGMTRAKDELTLSCTVKRMIRGRTQRQIVSAFLSEMGSERVRVENLVTPAAYEPQRRPSGGGFYEDAAARKRIEAMNRPGGDDEITYEPFEDDSAADYPPQYEYLKAGCPVRHPKFGPGKLVQLKQPWPETRAVIDFQTCGRKTIVLQYTELELL